MQHVDTAVKQIALLRHLRAVSSHRISVEEKRAVNIRPPQPPFRRQIFPHELHFAAAGFKVERVEDEDRGHRIGASLLQP